MLHFTVPLALAHLALRAAGARKRNRANTQGSMTDTAADAMNDDERAFLAKGAEYISQSGLDSESKAYLLGTAPPLSRADWAATYTGVMRALPNRGVEVDDHKGTPIGQGETIGLMAANFTLDPTQVDKLPRNFQTGLFGMCDQACPTWKAALRVSHTNAVDVDLMRFALKIHTEQYGEVDFHFTETLKVFPIKDRRQLEAFTYMTEHGTGWALFYYPVSMAQMGSQSSSLSSSYSGLDKVAGSLGKTYYSMTPFRLGAPTLTPGAFKIRLVAQQSSNYPGGNGQQEYLRNMRNQLVADVQTKVHKFSFEIQVATSPQDHPINDAYTTWNEDTAPWIRMGTMEIPQQSFLSPVSVGNAVGSGLWVDGRAAFNSKELLFSPGNEAHPPIGDISSFRAFAYPVYDQARQEYLLRKPGGAPARCPWAQMMR